MKSLLLAIGILFGQLVAAQADPPPVPAIGVVQQLENDSLLYAAGFTVLVDATPRILSPRHLSEEAFEAQLATIAGLRVPLYGCNLFIPADLKVVGPEVDEAAVLAYVDTVLRRAQRAGLTLITWGSGGSRQVPEGFAQARATEQFVYMARKVADVAQTYGILLVLENLNSGECNFITTLVEALAIVKAVDHTHLRLCVDIYHMLVDGEPASSIVGTGPYAVYCELAEREDRAPPGTHGDDFTPYFAALRAEGYRGMVVIECRWNDLSEQGSAAYAEVSRQLEAAYR
ncbi:hypothetical protein LEM8419_02764 [Neolewinella maritima]|uniref:Xylose isomerase-like TIM barrel domain-containing protein n=1 Tax=Neolewinella maritima TaxID=1383882 RepID=A0ABM9B3D1_9BACT|nr:sugar phosphate isomerase/epimerase family protein [Neolewinella maritima]CAH1001856.1 hypothetical protein LEM8419_02764 [Neolewinella maritima]